MKITTPLKSVGWLGSPSYRVGGRNMEELQSLEEAWDAWSKATCDFMDAMCDDDPPPLQEEAENRLNAATRNLALVVLEEIVQYDSDHEPDHEVVYDMGWCCREHWITHRLLGRIEALGKPDA